MHCTIYVIVYGQNMIVGLCLYLFLLCATGCYAIYLCPCPKSVRACETGNSLVQYYVFFLHFALIEYQLRGAYLYSLDFLAVSDEKLADKIAHLPSPPAISSSSPSGKIGI